MTCSTSATKDYFFGELPASGRAEFEQHIAACVGCREELSELLLIRTALLTVPDEEPPRRIAFISDKVFEPRWYRRFWASAPQLGFASAALLAAAIFSHGALTARTGVPSDRAALETFVREAVAEGHQRNQSDILLIQEYLLRQQKLNAVRKHNAYYQELR